MYPEDAFQTASLGPDYMGWIFSPRSQRRVHPHQVEKMIRRIRTTYPAIKHVGVFAENTIPYIFDTVLKTRHLDFVQTTGGSGFIKDLHAFMHAGKERLALSGISRPPGIIPAVRVKHPLTDLELSNYGKATFFILDAYVPGQPGGTGVRIDSDLIATVRIPYLLAGGIRPDNVSGAIAATLCVGVDVSSGVEDGIPGRKNMEKIRELISRVKSFRRLDFSGPTLLPAHSK